MKARLFINRALDHEDREFEERAFWATCALELLGKSALVRISPLLVVSTSDKGDGKAIFAAAGIGLSDESLLTIGAGVLWLRCQRAFPEFRSEEAAKFAADRNDYLHSGAVVTRHAGERDWWGRFWTQAAILVENCGYGLEQFVGPDRAPDVEVHLQQDKKNVRRRFDTLIARAQTLKQQHDHGTLPARAALDWEAYSSVFTYAHRSPAKCPACPGWGQVLGDDYESSRVVEIEESEWDYEAILMVQVRVAAFECQHCHLAISETPLLSLAGLDEFFEIEGDFEDYSHAVLDQQRAAEDSEA